MVDEGSDKSRWERRAAKLKKRREGMRVTGAGLKKVLLPLLRRKAEEGESPPHRKRAKGRRRKR